MSPRVALGVLAGLGFGLGVLLVIAGWRGTNSPALPRRRPRASGKDLALGLATGLVVLVITRWIAVAIAIAVLVVHRRQFFGGARASRAATDRLEALAAWTESLRDLVATGAALPEAVSASATAAAPSLHAPLRQLTERLAAREPLEQALRAFGDELDDVSADLVVAALLLNSRAQGRQLHAVLSALARSARSELAMRLAVEAERRATRRGVRIVLAVTVLMALGLDLLNPSYVAPYRTAVGQLVLTLVVAIFVFAFGWLQRLAQVPVARRFLDTPTQPGAPRSGVTRSLSSVGVAR